MIRLLLSLLALVSGLAVQGVPAQARMCSPCETEINAQVPARAAAHVAARVMALAVLPHSPAVRVAGHARRLPAALVVSRPGVLIGIDRARE